ncbi:LCP family protein [Frondihabitans australicus]|uniref:LytR family transcriptional attenuator n=1 Tax=Frondihabitans australicus TaxID=386892 RepID=A0A495IDD7_9MICO|nr:LCP family protein [Frondihabitans australicus]RKR73125.1 LytR family transcriptional attenuator [Frondihabitans australicus]
MPHADSAPTRATTRRGRRRRRAVRRGLIAAAVVVALLASAVGAGALLLRSEVTKNVTTLPASQVFPDEAQRPAPSKGAKNILLLGSDSRQASDQHDLDGAGGQRSDVMMLAHIPADRSGVQIMSIMRDTWVDVPGHGQAKINAALAWGGVPLTVRTVENLLGVRIDHVAIIDFAGVEGITTALGGVWVDNAMPFTSGGHFFAAGPIELEGPLALRYVRERHAFATADYQRVQNQQALLKGILDRAVSRDVLGDPRQLLGFVSETSKYLTVDSGFTTGEAASLAYSLRGIDGSAIAFFTMPTAGTGTSADGQSIIRLDPGALAKVRSALAGDSLQELAKSPSADR